MTESRPFTICCDCRKTFGEGDKVYELRVGKYMGDGRSDSETLEMTCAKCMERRP